MAVLTVIKLGNPLLRQRALPVDPSEIRKPAFQQLIDDMFETMYDEPGIGWMRRVFEHFRRVVWLDPEPERGWE